MDDINKLKAVVEDLRGRLKRETQLRIECQKRCTMLEKLAFQDPTTGLLTESFFYARVRQEIERATRFPAATSLVTLCAPQEHAVAVPMLGQRLSDEVRSTDQVFSLSRNGLALLLVETPGEGAQQLLTRLAEDLEHFVRGYGFTVTSFPVDANLAEDFLRLVFQRHEQMAGRICPGANGTMPGEAALH